MTEGKLIMRKYAGIYTNMLMNNIGDTVGYSIPLLNQYMSPIKAIGYISGVSADPNSDEEIERNPAKYLIPGYGTREIQRARVKKHSESGSKSPRALTVSEDFGNLVSGIPSTIAGALAGAAVGDAVGDANKERVLGAGIGAGVGLAVPSLIASLAALMTKTRTNEEQRKYSGSGASAWLNYLIPGMATYNKLKTTGRIHKDQDEAEEEAAKRKKSDDEKA